MTSRPKITLVTPSFNQGEFLEETIDSILSQGYPRLEYIVIDGGSTDDSLRILKKHHAHLSYWVSEPDRGQSHALNKGFARATGDILTWICSDDLLKPDALRTAADHMQENPEIGVIHGGCTLLEAGQETRTTFGNAEHWPHNYFTYMAFPQPAAFFRRTLWQAVGPLDESLHYAMDYDLFLRMRLQADFLPVQEVFAVYRLHPQSKTVSQQEKFAEEYRIVFSRWVRSIGYKQAQQQLIRLGDYRAHAITYAIPDHWTDDFWAVVWQHWLEHQTHLAFGNRDFARVLALGDTLTALGSISPALQPLLDAARYEQASLGQRVWLRLQKLFSP
ncbi:MAG: glycosyltransferase family 2 protein [Bernardetiaceae bacterium]